MKGSRPGSAPRESEVQWVWPERLRALFEEFNGKAEDIVFGQWMAPPLREDEPPAALRGEAENP